MITNHSVFIVQSDKTAFWSLSRVEGVGFFQTQVQKEQPIKICSFLNSSLAIVLKKDAFLLSYALLLPQASTFLCAEGLSLIIHHKLIALRPRRKVWNCSFFFCMYQSFVASSRRESRVFAVATSMDDASGNIPAAPISLPEGSWKQVSLTLHCFGLLSLLQSLKVWILLIR